MAYRGNKQLMRTQLVGDMYIERCCPLTEMATVAEIHDEKDESLGYDAVVYVYAHRRGNTADSR